ncbi:hypothetical protein ACI5KX_02765 [Erythrobacter sp. GH1-10]|uniref:hypothetical protein n=1 Tax=Erythrobacter sp. GH1-10 TaxID=3349334 RepID=UPI003877FEE6
MAFCASETDQKDDVILMTKPIFRLPKRVALAAAALSIGLGVPALAQSDGLAMLNDLAKGEWTIKHRDGTPERKICVRSGRELIQLKHTESGCSRFVVEDGAARVTVQYTCPGNGYGRTHIRKESGSLVQIESQGIESGTPFQFTAEARRTGGC